MANELLRDDEQDGSRHKTGRGNTRLTREQYEEAKRCYEILRATPKMSELARRWGMRPQTLVSTISRGIKQYDQEANDRSR